MKLSRKQAKPILNASFPDYSGRKIKLVETDHVTLCDLNWGGGSRNYYCLLRASDGAAMHYEPAAPWAEMNEGSRVALSPRVLVVEHSIFCGQDCGITIYAHPEAMARLKPMLLK